MDNQNFIKNCKLLKQHFTKLSQADTNQQTPANSSNSNIALDIITEAKKLLLFEQFEALSDTDIVNLRQNTVEKYANTLKQLTSVKRREKLCEKSHVKWNDEAFTDFVPNPKNYPEKKTNCAKLVQRTDLQIAKFLENCKEFKNEVQGMKIREMDEEFKEEEEVIERIDGIVEKVDGVSEVMELKITGQMNAEIGTILEVKKCFQNFEPETNETKVLRNILKKWLEITKNSKLKQIKTQNHNKKINDFVENLKNYKLSNTMKSKSNLEGTKKITLTKKPKSSPNLNPKIANFEHRFKAQKNIIQTQKTKLEEQTRIIEELKLNKIQKATKESLEKAELNYIKTISESSKHKYKIKPAQTEPELPDSDPNQVGLTLYLSKAPKIVQMMEDRAKARFEKRILIQERKRLIENEKQKIAEEAVKRKLEEEIEEKSKRTERMKKQREKVRLLEYRKQREKIRFIELNQNAIIHFKRKLLKFGFNHLKNIIYTVKIKCEIAKRFYEHNLALTHFNIWALTVKTITNIKSKKAHEIYKKNVQCRMLKIWQQHQFEAVQKHQVAIDRYDMCLQHRTFIYWHRLVCEYHFQFRIYAEKADKHYRRVLLFQCLHSWRSLPAIMQIEKVQNERKRKWRLRVAEILTDYDPTKANYD